MGVTVFHSLTATTPDNTQYEIRPSHWNSNHIASLSLAGSDLSNAFSNSPTVTFGTSGGLMTASVFTNYAATNITTNAIALSNSSLFQQTSATSAITSAAFASANSSLLIATSNSSLFQQTSATSAITSNAFATSNSSLLVATSNSSLFQQTSATSAITSAAFPSAQTTKFAGTGTTFSGTNVSGSMTLNSNGLNLALSAGAGGGGSFSAGISTGGNTSGNTGTVSNQIVFVGGNNVTLSGSTAAGGATVTISGANIGGAQTGISGVAVSNTTYTSGTFSFRDGNNISFASGTGQGVSITHNLQSAGAYLTTAAQSNQVVNSLNGSTGQISLNVGSSLSASTLGSAITFGLASNITTALQSTGNYLTTAMQSNAGSNFLGTNTALTANGVSVTANSSGLSLNFPAFLTTAMQSQSSSVFAKTGFTSTTTAGTAIVATHDTNGLSMGIPAYITTYAAQTAQTANLYATGANTTQLSSTAGVDLRSISISGAGAASAGVSGGVILVSAPPVSVLSGLGNITVGTTGSTIGISGGGGGGSFSAGISTGGNTSGTTGTVSNQIVFVGGNNVTLSGSTGAGGATVTISGANIGGAQTGISGVAVSNTTYTSGTFSFRDGNNISFASGTGQGVSITHNLQSAGAYLTTAMQSNAGSNFLGTNTALTANGVSVTANSSGLSLNFPAFLTTAMQSQSSSVFAKTGFTSTTTAGTAIVATHDTNGLSMGIPAFITAAGGAQTAISGMAVSNTTYTSGTVSFRDGNNISFASGTGQGISITHNLQSAGAYLTTAMQSNAGSNFLGTNTALTANGVSVTANSSGLSLNFPAFLTTAMQSNAGSNFLGTNTALTANGVSATANSSGLSLNFPAFLTTAMQSNAGSNFLGTNTALTANGVSVTANSSGLSLNFPAFLTTAAQSSASNVSLVVAGTASNGGTASLSGGVSFSNANGVSFFTSAGNAIVATVKTDYLTTAMQSNAGSNFLGTNTALTANGVSVTANSSGLSLNFPAFLTTAMQSQSSSVFAKTGFTSTTTAGTAIVATHDTNGLSMGIPAYITTYAAQTAQTANLYATGVNTTQLSSTAGVDLRSISVSGAGAASAGVSGGIILVSAPPVSVLSGLGNITVGTTGSTIGISGGGGGGAFSAGISTGGNTSGNTGTVSNQIVFVGGNNVTLSGSTAAGGATVTISGANIGGAQTGISGVAVSNTTYTSGTFSFRDGNNISFASGTGQGVSITHNLQSAGAYLTTAMQSNAGSNFLGTNTALTANGVSVTANSSGLSLNFPAFLTTAAQSSASNVSQIIAGTAAAGGTATLTGGVSFSNANGISFFTSAGNAIVATVKTDYLTTAMQSNAGSNFLGTNTALTANGVSVTANSSGLSLNFPAFLTTAAQSSASNVSAIVAGTASNGGTASLSGAVSFSNANGVSFYTSAGGAVVATVKTDYLTTAMQSNAGSNFLGTNTALTANGVSVTANSSGLSLNFPAFLTTAAQSSASNVSVAIAATNNTGGGTGSLSGGVSFSNANGLTFYTSAGNAIVASYTVPTVPTSYVSNVNGSSGAVSVAGTGFSSTTTAGTAVVGTLNTAGLSLGIPAFITAAGGVQTAISGMALSNTTYTSGTVSFRDGNNISFASGTGQGISITHNLQSAGNYLTTAMQSQSSSVFAKTGFTSTTTAGTAIVATHDTNGLSMGIPAYITTAPSTAGLISAINVSAGTTSNNLSAITFANTGNVTFGMAGSVITASAPSGGGGGGVAIAASNTTFTSGTVVMSAAGGALTISSGAQSVLLSVPQTSSIVAASGVSLSTNGSTIYLYNDFHDFFSAGVVGNTTTYTNSNNSVLAFLPLYPVDNYSFTAFEQLAYWLWTSTANASYAASQTLRYGLYKMDTANGSQLTLVNSSSMFMNISANSNVSGAYTVNFNNSATSFSSSSAGTGVLSAIAGRSMVLRLPFAGSFQAGEVYALGMHYSYTQTNATTNSRPLYQWGNVANIFTSGQGLGFIGPSTVDGGATTAQLENQGWIYSASTGALPNTISTNESRANASGFAPQVIFKNIQ